MKKLKTLLFVYYSLTLKSGMLLKKTWGRLLAFCLLAFALTGCPNTQVSLPKTSAPEMFAVSFGVDGSGGTLEAVADGAPISSGDKIEKNKVIIFTAVPAAGYKLAKWTGGAVQDSSDPNKASLKLNSSATVSASFIKNLTADTSSFEKYTGDVFTYKLVTAGSGSYTAVPEHSAVLAASINSDGEITLNCQSSGTSFITVSDTVSGQSAARD